VIEPRGALLSPLRGFVRVFTLFPRLAPWAVFFRSFGAWSVDRFGNFVVIRVKGVTVITALQGLSSTQLARDRIVERG
jgi:hypothetical protein